MQQAGTKALQYEAKSSRKGDPQGTVQDLPILSMVKICIYKNKSFLFSQTRKILWDLKIQTNTQARLEDLT